MKDVLLPDSLRRAFVLAVNAVFTEEITSCYSITQKIAQKSY